MHAHQSSAPRIAGTQMAACPLKKRLEKHQANKKFLIFNSSGEK